MTTKASTNPRFLLVTRNFPPLTGGMERLMQNAAQGISSYAELTIVGPRGCGAHAPSGVTVIEVPANLASFLLFGTISAARANQRKKFDMVIGGSGLTAPALWIIKKLFKLPTVVFVHGLDIVVNNAIYQHVFVPAIRAADLIIANSQNTKALAIAKGAAADNITVINPGTTLSDPPSAHCRNAFRNKHNIRFPKTLLFTGRITRRKGLSQFISESFLEIISSRQDIGLIVVGQEPTDSLNQEGEEQAVLQLVNDHGLEDKVQFLGKLNETDLLNAYALADLQVFPLINVPGDVEGFGMVAIEAAAMGTPTVAFALGGVGDAVSKDNGSLVEAGDYEQFTLEILQTLDSGEPDYKSCIAHANNFSWPAFHQQLQNALKRLPVKPSH